MPAGFPGTDRAGLALCNGAAMVAALSAARVVSLPTNDSRGRYLRRLLALAERLPSLVILGRLLSGVRSREAARHLRVALPRVFSLAGRVLSREREAVREYDREVADVIAALRSPETGGRLESLLSALDRATLADRREYCDDPSAPAAVHRSVMKTLAFLNDGLGSYRIWTDLLRPDLVTDGRPTRVLDLAAGHGGFALDLKARFGASVDVTATDVFDEYLDLGRAEARLRGLDVRFVRQDATDLRDLDAGSYDVVVCTQTIHHFAPGMVARIASEASRVAARAVWLVDGERTLLGAAILGLVAALYARSWPAVHDTVVSLRKMYNEEELAAIARLAPCGPAGSHATTGRVAPGFTYVRISPWSTRSSSVSVPPVLNVAV